MTEEEKNLLNAFFLPRVYWFATGVAVGLTVASLIVVWRL